jgi:hypothetical protein
LSCSLGGLLSSRSIAFFAVVPRPSAELRIKIGYNSTGLL